MPTEEISILFRHPSRRILRRPLREFLNQAARLIMPGRGVACLITGDQELRELNRRFLRKDYATDVLSFPASKDTPNGQPGEMAISLDRAFAQAAALGHSLEEELRILMLHGLLHLAGMDHEIDTGQMARAEARWRKRLQLPPGLVERASA
jgi:probable rRNA maturation factor